MANKMLIDASHPEETRVVVVRGSRVEEFDFESESRKQLRGNIYLAKVTRVEPSLQAAFVDYGGNRHGFLAFSEIHPDYYQIPVADRQALIEAEEREDAEAEDNGLDAAGEVAAEAEAPVIAESAAEDPPVGDGESGDDGDSDGESGDDGGADAGDEAGDDIAEPTDGDIDDHGEAEADEPVESVGAEDALEELPVRKRVRQRRYKIQEVIKRRQIMLVQV
ncbi:MAG: ribonuclease E/G, partial [Alphaproteobacteria bacterium]